MTTFIPTDLKRIGYDRLTKDYAAYYEDQVIGFYPTYLDAETALNVYVLELLTEGLAVSADDEPTDEYEIQYENIPYPHGIGNPDTPADDEAH